MAPTSRAQILVSTAFSSLPASSLLHFLSFFFSPRSELSGAAAVAAGRSWRRQRSRAARLGGGAARQGAWTGAARQRRRGSSIPGIRPRWLAPRRSHRRRRRRALHRRRRAPDPPPRGAAAACLPGLRAPPSAGRTTGAARIRRRLYKIFYFFI